MEYIAEKFTRSELIHRDTQIKWQTVNIVNRDRTQPLLHSATSGQKIEQINEDNQYDKKRCPSFIRDTLFVILANIHVN